MNNEPNLNEQKQEEKPAPQPVYTPDNVTPGATQYAPDPFADQKNEKTGKGLAITSMVFGILSVVSFCCCCFLPPISIAFGVVAIVLAIIYSKKAGKLDGMALAGLILGIIGVVFAVATIIICALNSESINIYFNDFWNNMREQYPDYDFGMYSGN